MSIYTRGEPSANQQFRNNTDLRNKMLNADLHQRLERCVCCGKRRNMRTGNVKAGKFICHGCNRQVAKSAD